MNSFRKFTRSKTFSIGVFLHQNLIVKKWISWDQTSGLRSLSPGWVVNKTSFFESQQKNIECIAATAPTRSSVNNTFVLSISRFRGQKCSSALVLKLDRNMIFLENILRENILNVISEKVWRLWMLMCRAIFSGKAISRNSTLEFVWFSSTSSGTGMQYSGW